MADVYEEVDRLADEAKKRARPWLFRADFVHSRLLPPNTWLVDGEVREEELNEANLLAAVNREGAKKPLVSVSAPLHLVLARITGFMPPYDKEEAAA